MLVNNLGLGCAVSPVIKVLELGTIDLVKYLYSDIITSSLQTLKNGINLRRLIRKVR